MSEQKIPTALGTEKISKLLTQYAIPAIIAMTASSLYNMVDSIFIGHLGKLAISGLAVTFPLMNLAAAFGSLVGVGAATLVSVKLGQKDYDTAQRVLGNVVILNIVIGLLFAILALMFIDPILQFFGADDLETDATGNSVLSYSRDFIVIILFGNLITHLYFGLNNVLRAAGHPKQAMAATITTVITNTILAPIFIYLFGWGIRGAACATVTAQLVSLLWLIKLFSNKKELIHFRMGIFRLKRDIVFNSLSIGMSPFLMNLAATVVVLLINQGLKSHGGVIAIGAYGIVNRLVFLFLMIVMGLNQGMQPIAGYNFGAQLYPRVTQVLKMTIFVATAITTCGFLMGMLIPRLAVSIFTPDAEMIDVASKGLRYVVMSFPIVGFQMVTANFFQSLGMAGKAIFLSLTRQVLFLIPCLLILPQFFGTAGVWMSMPVADLVASIVAAIMLWQQFRIFRRAVKQHIQL
jgi:putative MATE family efflux protein